MALDSQIRGSVSRICMETARPSICAIARMARQAHIAPLHSHSMSDPVGVLIVDDEPHARAGIRVLLERHADMKILGEAEDGPGAVKAIRDLRPALVLLDIQMPGMNGMDVAAEFAGRSDAPTIVFITAYDEFAVRAFEVSALDYLVKPFTDERFDRMLDRVRDAVRSSHAVNLGERLLQLADDAGLIRDIEPPGGSYRDRIVYREGGASFVVDIADVNWIEAASYYARIHVSRDIRGSRSFLVRESLTSLVPQLDPRDFVRVHRSAIVRIEQIAEVEERIVVLKSGERVPLAKTSATRVRALFADH